MELEVARQILLDHSKHPRNKLMPSASHYRFFGECQNPICGDHVQIYLDLDGELIRDIQLQLKGCTMCTASASLMGEAIKGKRRGDIQRIKNLFEETLLNAEVSWPPELEAFEALRHLKVNPARIPCALISWYALKQAIEGTEFRTREFS